jgi:flavin reductase
MDLTASFRQAMRQFAGTVTAITATGEEGSVGLIATAVCSLSAEPPSVLVCINRNASAYDVIVKQAMFGVTVLHPTQCDVVRRFGTEKGPLRFQGAPWDYSSGVPLLQGAVVSIKCRLHTVYDGFSHGILIGIAEEIHVKDEDGDGCLLWKGQQLHRPIPLFEGSGN